MRRADKLESVLRNLRGQSGLYLLGAGMSAGLVPFGKGFMAAPAIDYVRNSGGFPVERPKQNVRTQRARRAGIGLSLGDFFPKREWRPGAMDDFPLKEMLERLNDTHVYLHMAHLLTRPRAERQRSDSYELFREFPASLLLNYNLDGMAQRLCGAQHRILAMHGVFPDGYGSRRFVEILESAREWGFPLAPDANLLCEPEQRDDRALTRKLFAASRANLGFAALIGYSFGQQDEGFDDAISLAWFIHRLKGFAGPAYIFDPAPQSLRDMIADAIKSDLVIGVPVYWNVFAHAVRQRSRHGARKSLHYHCQQILDSSGSNQSFSSSDGITAAR